MAKKRYADIDDMTAFKNNVYANFARIDHTHDGMSSLPDVGEEDDGKVLMVSNGAWAASSLPTYEGDYEVTPTADGQTLNTAKKLMEGDVTVKAIPYYETSNESGGNTLYIASEVE